MKDFRTIIRYGLVCLVLLFTWGGSTAFCQDASQTENGPFKIGLVPEQNIFKQLDRYQILADYMADRIGSEITLKILTRYGNIVENFVMLELDAAFFGSFTYTLARAKLGVEVIARPENQMGVSSYHGLIFVRKDSGIQDVEGMQGKSFAFVDKATTAGYILPLAYFKRHGVQDYRSYLKETYFAGTHDDVIYDVLNRRADIGAAKNTIFFKLAAENDRISKELTILERSADVPENGLAVRKDFNPELKTRIKEVLLSMHKDPKGQQVLKRFGARGFIETADSDYANVLRLVQETGIDLRTYDYLND